MPENFSDYVCIKKANGDFTDDELSKINAANSGVIIQEADIWRTYSSSLRQFSDQCSKQRADAKNPQIEMCKLILKKDWLDPSINKRCYIVKKNSDGTFEKQTDPTTGDDLVYVTKSDCNKNPDTTSYETNPLNIL